MLKILIFFLRLPVSWDDRSEMWFNYVSWFGLRSEFETLVSVKDEVIHCVVSCVVSVKRQ